MTRGISCLLTEQTRAGTRRQFLRKVRGFKICSARLVGGFVGVPCQDSIEVRDLLLEETKSFLGA